MHVQPWKYLLDHANRTAPSRKHELLIDHLLVQIRNLCALKYLDHDLGIDHLSDDLWKLGATHATAEVRASIVMRISKLAHVRTDRSSRS